MSTTDFLPAVFVFSIDMQTGQGAISSAENWNFKWSQAEDTDGTGKKKTPIDSIDCWTLIDTFTELSEADREAMKAELVDGISCPNTKQIKVEGNFLTGSANFNLGVSVSEYGKEHGITNNYNIVFSLAFSRYFSAEEFSKQGFMTPITTSQSEVPVQAA